ncbi:peptidase inhibitor family I36 protein [Streptomyces sp. NPDC048357]|uniref:peptidase inhibitor family I36 protein n=1 Tax=Streptomyces sp. NPDC048357 TaxID=3154719 RepID=UPI0034257213
MKLKRVAATAAALSAFAGVGLALAAPASASSMLGSNCSDLRSYGQCLQLFYNSGFGGSYSYYEGTTSVPVMASSDKFLTGGAGQGQEIKNNAASAKNHTSQGFWVSIYYNSWYDGPCDAIAPNKSASKLVNTYNENASAYTGKGDGCYVFN